MDHVHQKRLQTLKLRKQQAELENSALHKEKGAGAVQKSRHSSGSNYNLRSSLSSVQLARLFSDNHVPKSGTTNRLSESLDPDVPAVSTPTSGDSVPDVDMVDFVDLPADFVMKDDERDGDWEGSSRSSSPSQPDSPVQPSEVQALVGTSDSPIQPPPSIEEAAPGRSYRVYIGRPFFSLSPSLSHFHRKLTPCR